jgi:alpha-L-arabinofuranosidase
MRGVIATQRRAQVLHNSDINSHNSFEQPDRLIIKPHSVAVESGRFRVTLPSLSLSVAAVTLEVTPT